MSLNKIRNIGILAHVDAGKTTLTEQMLFNAGAIKIAGNVDKGTAISDFLDVEKERGISVKASTVSYVWKDIKINLIDTPGHVDFASEVEHSFKAFDAVVLVISAVEGVQSHTETIWSAIHKLNIPCIFFINKCDRPGSDTKQVITEIKKTLSPDIFVLQKVSGEESNSINLKSIWNSNEINDDLLEILAERDECLLEKFMEEKVTFEEADKTLISLTEKSYLYLLLMGSAKNNCGVTEILDAIVKYFPSPYVNPGNELSGVVFKTAINKQFGRMAYVRMFNGKINIRDCVKVSSLDDKQKITQLFSFSGGKLYPVNCLEAGNIGCICGIKEAKIGDYIGEKARDFPDINLNTPLLTVQAIPTEEKNYATLAYALQELDREDPYLDFQWIKEERELHIKIMGWIQIEVLEKILLNRFEIAAKFENPSVIYKETPLDVGKGFVNYTMPKPCWAILKFLIGPGEVGSGIKFKSEVSVNKIHRKYQNEVEKTIPLALKQGIKGWEVTDILITLIDGEDHEIHSRPGDFIVATPMGIIEGLKSIGTSLLEPVLNFTIKAGEDLLGKVVGDIMMMRGTFENPLIGDGKFILKGILPVSTSIDYPIKLSSRSGGKAKITTHFAGYRKCSDEEGVIRKFQGISPLDRAKWILQARKAITQSQKS